MQHSLTHTVHAHTVAKRQHCAAAALIGMNKTEKERWRRRQKQTKFLFYWLYTCTTHETTTLKKNTRAWLSECIRFCCSSQAHTDIRRYQLKPREMCGPHTQYTYTRDEWRIYAQKWIKIRNSNRKLKLYHRFRSFSASIETANRTARTLWRCRFKLFVAQHFHRNDR